MHRAERVPSAPTSLRSGGPLDRLSESSTRNIADRQSNTRSAIGKYNLTPMEQFGGRSNSSCQDALISLTHDIQTAWKQKQVFSFLVVDVKGFFDHIHHDRLIKVLWDKGFDIPTCLWTKSFASDRSCAFRLDDFLSDTKDIHIGLAQGSLISPTLACLYASEALERMIEEPTYSKSIIKRDGTRETKYPVGPRAYVDDHGLGAISNNFVNTNAALQVAASRLVDLLDEIGLKIDPRKSEIMHFSGRLKVDPPEPLELNLYGTRTLIRPPTTGYIRWLGAFLDSKLSWKLHAQVMNERGRTILSGMKLLGNTIRGMNQSNKRTLVNACIEPVLTYCAPIVTIFTFSLIFF